MLAGLGIYHRWESVAPFLGDSPKKCILSSIFQEARERERKAQEEMDDLFDEDSEFMRSFMQKRMEELMDQNVSTVSAYGKIIDIHNDGHGLSIFSFVQLVGNDKIEN